MALLGSARAAKYAEREVLDAGVVRDAGARQRRALAACVVFAIVVGLVVFAAHAGGAAARSTVPQPGATTGSLRALSSAEYQYWVTPDLGAGEVSLDYRVTFASGLGWGENACECDNYPGSTRLSREWFPGTLGLSIDSGPGVTAPTPNDVVTFVAGNVAALRVGQLGEVGAQAARDLPPGVKVAAFRLEVPQRPSRQFARLSALGSGGQTLPAVGLNSKGFTTEPVSAHGGACAIRSDVPGIENEASNAVTVLNALPATLPGLFLTCLQDPASLDGANLQIAVLVNAHHPGQTPAALWGSTPLPGHPGVIELKAPSRFGFNVDTGSPMLARRVGNAWIIVGGRPGLPPAPTLRERLQTLDKTHITRLDLTK